MPEYKKLFKPLIEAVEGRTNKVHRDINSVPTAGVGFNLQDADIQGIMGANNIDHNEVAAGNRDLSDPEIDAIQDSYMDKREPLVRNQIGGDMYDLLQPHEKAAVMSMGYQSLNNLGPSLKGYLSSGDKIGALREVMLNTNKQKDPGILVRRLKEAELMGGPLDFSSTFKTMSDQEKKDMLEMLNQIKNENTRQEVLEKYAPYLQGPPSNRFSKLVGK